MEEHEVGQVASYGVGAGLPEGWLHRLRPGRPLTISEYAPETVARLRIVFPEADTRVHDLLTDTPPPADVHLFHRLDPDFTDGQWREIFQRFARERVLFVASLILDWQWFTIERSQRKRGAMRCGVLRNRRAMEALWRRTHEAEPITLHDLQGWVLTPRA